MNIAYGLAFLGLSTLVGLGAYLAGARWHRAHQSAQLERANAELARRLRELFLLQELSYLLSESLEFDRTAEQIARYLVRFLDAQGAMVALADEKAGYLRVAAADGSLGGVVGRVLPRRDAGLVGEALQREKLEMIESLTPTELLPGLVVRRAAVAPLRAQGVVTGAIVAVDAPDPFGPDHLRLLSTVAAHAAVVLTNARLFDQLRTGKEQWESTFDALADGVAVLDDTGRIQRANRALAALLGQSLPQVVGRDLAEELFGRPSALADLYRVARRGERTAPVIQRSEALRRVFRIGAAPMQGEDTPGSLVVLVEDVTEQKAFEAQMIQHEKMAAVGQLVSGVAHELNNPLTSVSGLAELLLEQPATPSSAKEQLRIIHEQAERAGKIVRNLLTFARQGPAEVASVDVGDVVRRTALLLEYEVRLQHVDLVTELPPDPVVVQADRMQLQQVVVNLVTNAVQAVATNPPERARRVVVRASVRGDRVAIDVEDTGPGVPPELASRIFTPFFTTKEPGVGTGLGLAISYGIMARYGGTLEVRRAPGGGALFVAELPAATLAGASPQDGGRTGNPHHAPTSGRRVLLVDGDPAVQRMIGMVFSVDGHWVEAARDGAHAVELLSQGSYDLVIADPRTGVGGEMLAETLGARWPGLMRRTIFATADVRPETEEWLKRLGGRYVHKPVSARQLRAVAAELLNGKD